MGVRMLLESLGLNEILQDKLRIVSVHYGCEPAEIAKQILEFGIEMEFLRSINPLGTKKEKDPPIPPQKEKNNILYNNNSFGKEGGSGGENPFLDLPKMSPLEKKAAAKSKRKKPKVDMPIAWVRDRDQGTIRDQELVKYAESVGYDWYGAKELFLSFVDYHQAKGNKFVKWIAAWRTWVRNDTKFNGPPRAKKTDSVLSSYKKHSIIEDMFNDKS
jgi:hypothetical protein